MKRALLIGVIAGSISAAASAEVVTFSGVPFGVSPTSMPTYVENGVTVSSVDGSFWAYPNSGELHLDPDGFGNKTFDFTFVGGAFDLVSFDITFADSSFVAFLEGFDQNGALLNSMPLHPGRASALRPDLSRLVYQDFGDVLVRKPLLERRDIGGKIDA